MGRKLDIADMKIISSLQTDARCSITSLARLAGVSRPTVMNKIKRLQKNGLLNFSARTDLVKLNFKLANITVIFESKEKGSEFITRMKSCPRVLQILQMLDGDGYTMLVYAEDGDTLISFVEKLRNLVVGRFSWHRVKPMYGSEFILNIFSEKKEMTPCDVKCSECNYYKEYDCVGCPLSEDYVGRNIEV